MTGSPISAGAIQKIPAFRNFNETECRQMADLVKEKTFAPGEKIIVQAQTSQDLWILLDGKCEVVKDSAHDGRVVLAELEPYSLFGEMSFFSPAPHSANVVAKTPVKLVQIARADYDDLIRDGVAAAYKLAYNVVESVAMRLRRMDEWVAELSAHDLHQENNQNHQQPDHEAKEKQRDWREFREKLFNRWNL